MRSIAMTIVTLLAVVGSSIADAEPPQPDPNSRAQPGSATPSLTSQGPTPFVSPMTSGHPGLALISGDKDADARPSGASIGSVDYAIDAAMDVFPARPTEPGGSSEAVAEYFFLN